MLGDHDSALESIKSDIAQLEIEHRTLDKLIIAKQTEPDMNFLEIQRLKKRKLAIKDRLIYQRSNLVPNIIA